MDDYVLLEGQRIFTHCPLHSSLVDVDSVCRSCGWFGDTQNVDLIRAKERFDRGELAKEGYIEHCQVAQQNIPAVYVKCDYPSMRQCNSFKEVSD
jgi:hypothetical protein